MSLFFRIAVFTCAALFFAACQKDDQVTLQEETAPKFLLKAVQYTTFGIRADYSYHADSTLDKIVFSAPGSIDYQTSFGFEQKRIATISVSNSLYATRYIYDNSGRVRTVLHVLQGQENSGHKFDYSYHANGTVSQMKYYDLNEAGDQLKYTNIYHYGANGLLRSVEAVNGNNKITFEIEAYSDECWFNPWTFISTSLSPLYEIYNYPVLKGMKRLPVTITQKNSVNGGAATTTAVFQTAVTINRGRVEKTVSSVAYPAAPQHNSSSEAVYLYD